MPEVLNAMFEAFEKMLETNNPLLLQSHPYFDKILVFFSLFIIVVKNKYN